MPRHRPEYQEPPNDLVPLIWKRGAIEPWELLRIAAWKSANGNLAWLSLEEPSRIVSVTQECIQAIDSFKASSAMALRAEASTWEPFLEATRTALGRESGLQRLKGVGLPMASAILAILNPQAWAVFDRWATKVIFSPAPSATQMTYLSTYCDYLGRLADVGKAHKPGASIHEVDQWVMNLGIAGHAPPFDPIAVV